MQKPKINRSGTLFFPERITEAIKEIYHYPLTIIEAPMGYGKTTALKEHLKDSDACVLWHRIYDGDPNSFWNGFCRLFQEVDGERAQSLQHLGFPNDSVSRQEALNLMEGIRFSERTVLVLDDYHLMSGTELNRFVELLVAEELSDLLIVLTARFVEFPLMDEFALKGYLYHIPKETFEFDVSEIKAYYRLCGISLKNSEADRLLAFTEGWISALYLLMLNYKAEGSFETTVNIYSLVEKAVFMPFSDEIKELLLNLAVFKNFTADLAVHMCEKDNTPLLLTEIVNKSAMVKYDVKTKTYQMHNIFTGFLMEALESKGKGYDKKVYEKAAHWFMKSGSYLDAMHYFYTAGNFNGLMKAVEFDKGHSIFNEQKERFIQYFSECPYTIKQEHPTALLIYGLCLFTFNEMALFEEVCGEFVGALQNNEHLSEERRNALMGEFELLLSFTGYNDILKMSQHIESASRLLTHQAEFIDTKGGWTFGSPSVLYMFHREVGQLDAEVQNLKRSLPTYVELMGGHGTGGEFIMEAELFFNRGDFENAEITVHKALYMASRWEQGEIVVCAMFLQARLALAKGDYAYGCYLHQKMQEEIQRKKWYNQIQTIELCEAFINLELKRMERVPLRIAQGDFSSSRIYFPAMAFMNIVYGKALLMNNDYLKLLGIAEQFIGIASVFPNLMGHIYSYIYIAAAKDRIYRRDEAIEALKQAMDIAMADEIYMPFVENGGYLGPLLDILQRRGHYGREIAKIRELTISYQGAVEGIIHEHFTEKKPVLASREHEIARLAADGLSNKEIGEGLFISENTVKAILKRVFEKLEIKSRVQIKQYFNEKSAN